MVSGVRRLTTTRDNFFFFFFFYVVNYQTHHAYLNISVCYAHTLEHVYFKRLSWDITDYLIMLPKMKYGAQNFVRSNIQKFRLGCQNKSKRNSYSDKPPFVTFFVILIMFWTVERNKSKKTYSYLEFFILWILIGI